MPLISVIIPTNRVDSWLFDAINSVVNNGFEDMELIVCFDGTDLQDFDLVFPDLRVRKLVSKSHIGLPAILNLGIDAAESRFIARLDADDLMIFGRLRAQSDYLLKNPKVLAVASSTKIINEKNQIIGEYKVKDGDVLFELLRENVISHPSIMFRRDSVLEIGGYNESMSQMEDYDLWLRLRAKGVIENLSKSYTKYRVHSSQMSRSIGILNPYIRVVSKSRSDLAKLYGVNNFHIKLISFRWIIGQLIFGLKKAFRLKKLRGNF